MKGVLSWCKPYDAQTGPGQLCGVLLLRSSARSKGSCQKRLWKLVVPLRGWPGRGAVLLQRAGGTQGGHPSRSDHRGHSFEFQCWEELGHLWATGKFLNLRKTESCFHLWFGNWEAQSQRISLRSALGCAVCLSLTPTFLPFISSVSACVGIHSRVLGVLHSVWLCKPSGPLLNRSDCCKDLFSERFPLRLNNKLVV